MSLPPELLEQTEHGVDVYVAAVVRDAAAIVPEGYRDANVPIVARLQVLARRLVQAHAGGDAAVAISVHCWHPEKIGETAEVILAAPFMIDDARLTVAREHGFADWAEAESLGDATSDVDFERAVDAVIHGDLHSLRSLLENRPELIRQQSAFGHGARLLHYVGSNGVETHRQKAPLNLAEVTRALLDAGAEVDAVANIYGGSTTLGLLLSSGHPAEAGVADQVARILIDAGAATTD